MSRIRIPLVGKTFHRLTVLEEAGCLKGVRFLKCQCSCGTIGVWRYGTIVYGVAKSCGCLQKELASKRFTKHGMRRIPYYYNTWCHLKRRCYCQNDKSYANYGGRGITVYSEWYVSFKSFYDYVINDLGERPSKKYTIDRTDVNKGYYPGNIRWALASTQTYNRRFKSKLQSYQGVFASGKKFIAHISTNGTRLYLGTFENELDAVRAYNAKAMELHGNIPERNLI